MKFAENKFSRRLDSLRYARVPSGRNSPLLDVRVTRLLEYPSIFEAGDLTNSADPALQVML